MPKKEDGRQVVSAGPKGTTPIYTNSPSQEKVWLALAEVQSEILSIEKGERNDYSGYNYVGADSMILAFKPIFLKHGLLLVVGDQTIRDSHCEKSPLVLTQNYLLVHLESNQSAVFFQDWPIAAGNKPMDKSAATSMTSALGYKIRDLALVARTDAADNMDHPSNERSSGAAPARQAAPAAAASSGGVDRRDFWEDCPVCGEQNTVLKSKSNPGERYCWSKPGGCGVSWKTEADWISAKRSIAQAGGAPTEGEPFPGGALPDPEPPVWESPDAPYGE